LLGLLGAGDLDEDSWTDVEDTLLLADLGAATTTEIVDRLRAELAARAVRTPEQARAALRDVLIEALRPELDRAVRALPHNGADGVSVPGVVLIAGVNGTGKTTTTGKLARVLVADGRTVVATGGCFDLLHTGHVKLLRQARQLGDALIVLINSDDSVRALKGPDRPIMPAADRARILAALACVDAVGVFDDHTPERLLDAVRPDVWVKGGDYTACDLPEADVVQRHGGEVVIVPTVSGYSSSQLIATARSEHTIRRNAK